MFVEITESSNNALEKWHFSIKRLDKANFMIIQRRFCSFNQFNTRKELNLFTEIHVCRIILCRAIQIPDDSKRGILSLRESASGILIYGYIIKFVIFFRIVLHNLLFFRLSRLETAEHYVRSDYCIMVCEIIIHVDK